MRIYNPRRIGALLALAGIGILAAACGSSAPAQAKPSPTEPAKPAAAQSAAPTTDKLFINADIVQGTKNLPQDQMAAKTCVVSSRFPRNAEILWRARIIDPRTGNEMDDKALKKVDVKLADGTVIDGKYGKHGDVSFWTMVWSIPKDYPTGTVKYTVEAASTDGRTGEYEPIQVAPSLLTITSDVLADVPTPTPAKKQ